MGSHRVQTTTFSPVDVIEMFLAPTGGSDSAPSAACCLIRAQRDAFWVVKSVSES